MDKPTQRKIYLTDLDLDLTFYGVVESLTEVKGMLKVSLADVKVYEYSSSNYLYATPQISFLRPKNVIHIEEA